MSDENKNEKKEIRVVTGDTSELNISKVGEHLNSMKPKTKEEDEKKKKEIVIPQIKKIEIDNEDNK